MMATVTDATPKSGIRSLRVTAGLGLRRPLTGWGDMGQPPEIVSELLRWNALRSAILLDRTSWTLGQYENCAEGRSLRMGYRPWDGIDDGQWAMGDGRSPGQWAMGSRHCTILTVATLHSFARLPLSLALTCPLPSFSTANAHRPSPIRPGCQWPTGLYG